MAKKKEDRDVKWWEVEGELMSVEIGTITAGPRDRMTLVFSWHSKSHGWGDFTLVQREIGVDGCHALDVETEKMSKEFVGACLAKLLADAKLR
jgi:hypothetical protein